MNVALVGYGYWGQILEKYICPENELKLCAICDKSKLSNPLYHDSYEKILADADIEAVFIATPISTHYELCKKALISKKHVFCEKPTVRNTLELKELCLLAKNNNRVLYTNYNYTVSPSINHIKDSLMKIGKLVSIVGRIEQFDMRYPHDNVYEVLGVHMIASIFHITGMKARDIAFYDLYKLTTTTVGTIRYTLTNGADVEIFCSMLNCGKERKLHFFGTDGKFEFSLNTTPSCTLYNWKLINGQMCDTESQINHFEEAHGLSRAIAMFLHFIRAKDYDSNMDLAFEVLRCLEGGA